MQLTPITLKEANAFVKSFHRHNKPVARNGGRFAIGLVTDELMGVAIVGNPLARAFMDGGTAEVLRCCVRDEAPKNSCSKLYAACWRAWKAMGGHRLVTYTLTEESGSSLKGAGWKVVAELKPRPKGWSCKSRPREWQPIYGQQKLRWEAQ